MMVSMVVMTIVILLVNHNGKYGGSDDCDIVVNHDGEYTFFYEKPSFS